MLFSDDEVGYDEATSWQSQLGSIWEWGSVLVYTKGDCGSNDTDPAFTWEVDGVVISEEVAVVLPLGDETSVLRLAAKS